jgi:hypothetical protein
MSGTIFGNYQLMSYARLYECKDLMLLYPALPGGVSGPRKTLGLAKGDERLRIVTIDVSQPRSVLERTLSEQQHAMMAALRKKLGEPTLGRVKSADTP